MSLSERRARGLDWVGRDLTRDEERLESPIWSGTILMTGEWLGKRLWWDYPTLRAATPAMRFGNLFVFRDSFFVPGLTANIVYRTALRKIYTEKADLAVAQRLLAKSAALDPRAFLVEIELGNVCLRRGDRQCALQAYSTALENVPNDPAMRSLLENQVKHASVEPLDQVPELRNPALGELEYVREWARVLDIEVISGNNRLRTSPDQQRHSFSSSESAPPVALGG